MLRKKKYIVFGGLMELKVKQVKRHDGVREALYFPALFVGFRLTVKHFWRNLFGYIFLSLLSFLSWFSAYILFKRGYKIKS